MASIGSRFETDGIVVDGIVRSTVFYLNIFVILRLDLRS